MFPRSEGWGASRLGAGLLAGGGCAGAAGLTAVAAAAPSIESTVPPSWTSSPAASSTGSEMRSPLTKVPLEEPRSSRATAP